MNIRRPAASLLAAPRLLLLAATLSTHPLQAHEGHHHEAAGEPEAALQPAADEPGSAAPARPPAVPGAPRLALQQTPVELVAVQEPSALVIYIDDEASNAPLGGLRVQVQLGARVVQASESAVGEYRIPRGLIGEAGGEARFELAGDGLALDLSGALPAAAPAGAVNEPLADASSSARAATYRPPLDRVTIAIGALIALAGLAGGWTLKSRRPG